MLPQTTQNISGIRLPLLSRKRAWRTKSFLRQDMLPPDEIDGSLPPPGVVHRGKREGQGSVQVLVPAAASAGLAFDLVAKKDLLELET